MELDGDAVLRGDAVGFVAMAADEGGDLELVVFAAPA
jgi:hypothetical protein